MANVQRASRKAEPKEEERPSRAFVRHAVGEGKKKEKSSIETKQRRFLDWGAPHRFRVNPMILATATHGDSEGRDERAREKRTAGQELQSCPAWLKAETDPL